MTPCFLAIASATASPPVISTAQLLEYWAPLHDPNSRHTNTHTNRVHIIVRKLNNNDERLLSTWTIDTAHIVSTDEVTNCSHRRHENNHTHTDTGNKRTETEKFKVPKSWLWGHWKCTWQRMWCVYIVRRHIVAVYGVWINKDKDSENSER